MPSGQPTLSTICEVKHNNYFQDIFSVYVSEKYLISCKNNVCIIFEHINQEDVSEIILVLTSQNVNKVGWHEGINIPNLFSGSRYILWKISWSEQWFFHSLSLT